MTQPLSSDAELVVDAVLEVLARRGVARAELDALRDALGRVRDREATWGFLLRRRAQPSATISPIDGTVGIEGNEWFVLDDEGRERARFVAETQRCIHPAGTRVAAGEPLSDGAVDPGDLLDVHGEQMARPLLRTMLCAASGLSDAHADLLLAPMLDAIVVDPHCERVRRPASGSRMTRARFEHECARELREELRARRDAQSEAQHPAMDALLALDDDGLMDALPTLSSGPRWGVELLYALPRGALVLLGYDALRSMDPGGLLLDAGQLRELGSFEVRKGKLSLSAPQRMRRHPEHVRASETQRYFGARKGEWRAFLHIDSARAPERSLLGLRFWHASHTPRLDPSAVDGVVELESNVLVVTDLRKDVADAAREGSLDKTISALLAASPEPRVAKLEPGGWACAPGPGRYALVVERDDEGLLVALAIDLRRADSQNVALRPGFGLLCVLCAVKLGAVSPAVFEARMGEKLGVRVQFLEELTTLPSRDEAGDEVAGTGGRTDLLFAVALEDYSPEFNVERMSLGIRWLEDAVSSSNFPNGMLYPARVLDYLDPRVRRLVRPQ